MTSFFNSFDNFSKAHQRLFLTHEVSFPSYPSPSISVAACGGMGPLWGPWPQAPRALLVLAFQLPELELRGPCSEPSSLLSFTAITEMP